MQIVCRVCQIEFESPTYRPYCKEHAKAFENFKKLRNQSKNDEKSGVVLCSEVTSTKIQQNSQQSPLDRGLDQHDGENDKIEKAVTPSENFTPEITPNCNILPNDNDKGLGQKIEGFQNTSEANASVKTFVLPNEVKDLSLNLVANPQAQPHEKIIQRILPKPLLSGNFRLMPVTSTPSLISQGNVSRAKADSQPVSERPFSDENETVSAASKWIRHTTVDDRQTTTTLSSLVGASGKMEPYCFNYFYGNDVDEDPEEYLAQFGIKAIEWEDKEDTDAGEHSYSMARDFTRSSISKRRAIDDDTSSTFMEEEEERVDLSQLTLANVLKRTTLYPFTEEIEADHLESYIGLQQLQSGFARNLDEVNIAEEKEQSPVMAAEAVKKTFSRKRTRSVTPGESSATKLAKVKRPTLGRTRKNLDEDEDYVPQETNDKGQSARRTRGKVIDFYAMSEGPNVRDVGNEIISNWTNSKTDRAAPRDGSRGKRSIKPKNIALAGFATLDQSSCSVAEANNKNKGNCKVCAVECVFENRMPYCGIHASMFAAFKRKQLAQLQKGSVE